jgi:hypothetical protein
MISSVVFRPSSRNARASANADNEDHSGKNGNHESGDGEENGDHNNGDDDDGEEEEEDDKDKEVLPKGLVMWREGIRQAQTAAQGSIL